MVKKPDWKTHEEDMVSLLGGRGTKASGAGWYDKGDGKHDLSSVTPLLWDCKCTASDKYAINAETWFKLEKEAMHRTPVLFVRFAERADIAVMDSSFAYRLGIVTNDIPRVKRTLSATSEVPCVVEVDTPFGIPKPLACLSLEDFGERYARLVHE